MYERNLRKVCERKKRTKEIKEKTGERYKLKTDTKEMNRSNERM